MSARDTLSRHDLVSVAEQLYSLGSVKITELGKVLGIQEIEMQSLKQFSTPDDFPLLLLLEWKKRHTVASRPQLTRALLACGMRMLAVKLDSTGEN